MPKRILIVGIRGCIGGSVFAALKSIYPEHNYTALVRKPSDVEAVRAAGATPTLSASTNGDTVAQLAENADIVVNCGGGFNAEYQQALLSGMQQRKSSGRGAGILIHTSGTAFFLDERQDGKYIDGKIWSDAEVDDIKAAAAKSEAARSLLKTILEASLQGDVYPYIIAPASVYGVGTGPVNRISMVIKDLARLYIEFGSTFVLGQGSNVCGWIHITDLVSIYLLVFDQAVTQYPPSTSPYERFFIASNELLQWRRVANSFGKALNRLGKLPSAEVVTRDASKVSPIYAALLAGNTLTKEVRGHEIGWVCSGPSLEECIGEDLRTLFTEK